MAKDKYYDELVIVKLYKNNRLTDDVFVTVEDMTLIVPRGKEVKIPRKHAIALQAMEAHKLETKSLTNYDRIKNMSIDEMAQAINDKTYRCVFRFGCPCDCEENIPKDCVEKIKQWLLQTV